MRYFIIFRCQKIDLTILHTWPIIIVKYLHKFKRSMWANNSLQVTKNSLEQWKNQCENMLQALALLKEKWDYFLLQ